MERRRPKIVAARIARAHGLFEQGGEKTPPLDCAECLKRPALREFLGCGQPPRFAPRRGADPIDWTPRAWREMRERHGWRDTLEERSKIWAFAGWGGRVGEAVGGWYQCPRSHDAFADDLAAHEADHIVRCAWWLSEGALDAYLDRPVTQREEWLIRFARSLHHAVDRDKFERRRAELNEDDDR